MSKRFAALVWLLGAVPAPARAQEATGPSVALLYGGDFHSLSQAGAPADVHSSGWVWNRLRAAAQLELSRFVVGGVLDYERVRATDPTADVASSPLGLWAGDVSLDFRGCTGALCLEAGAGYRLGQLALFTPGASAPEGDVLTRHAGSVNLGATLAVGRTSSLRGAVEGWLPFATLSSQPLASAAGWGLRGAIGWVQQLTGLGVAALQARAELEVRYDSATLTPRGASEARLGALRVGLLLGLGLGASNEPAPSAPVEAPAAVPARPAAPSPPEPGRPVEEKARLKLSFVDAATRGPLAQVEVSFRDQTYYSLADGTVSLSGLEPGEVAISAHRRGYRAAQSQVILAPGQDSELLIPLSATP